VATKCKTVKRQTLPRSVLTYIIYRMYTPNTAGKHLFRTRNTTTLQQRTTRLRYTIVTHFNIRLQFSIKPKR